jgi:VirB8 protein
VASARLVTPDVTLQREAIFRTYAMLHTKDPAAQQMNEWYNGNKDASPFARAAKVTVTTDINSVLPISGSTWQVDWQETTRDRAGALIGQPVHMRAMLTVYLERFVDDTQLSPLDLATAPNGNVLVSSEFPFGGPDAVTTVREYDAGSGKLVRIFSPDGSVGFRKPRDLLFGPDGNLYCAAHGEIVAFDFGDGRFLGAVAPIGPPQRAGNRVPSVKLSAMGSVRAGLQTARG